jgi:starvation-inducible DNA-binding protein
MPGPQLPGLSFVVDDQGDQIFAATDALAGRVRKSGCTIHLSVGHIARFGASWLILS